jgi:hypothetical protein
MNRLFIAALLFTGNAPLCDAADFRPPIRLQAGHANIRVESPGYASPCWGKINGKDYLLVGQMHQGKIQIYEHLDAARFAPGKWLQAAGKVAEVPGVW